MRYLKPHYYDKFQCVADQCPDTCCAGWQIVIDDDSLKKYEKTKGAFGNRLRNSINWQEGVFDQYDGLRELSLTLSCPVAAQIILGCKEKVQFLESFTEEEDDFEEFDFLLFSQLEDARDVIFKILQNRNLDLRDRIMAVCSLSEEFQTCIDEERAYDIDDLLRKYSENPNVSAQYEPSYESRLKEWTLLNRLERLRPEWTDVLLNCRELLYSGGKEQYERIYREFQCTCGFDSSQKESWSIMGEQLIMFFIYTYFCGAVYDDMVISKAGIAVFSCTWIQELLMARWLENGKELDFSDITEIAWRYAREVEHSDLNLDMLEEWIQKSWNLSPNSEF